MPAATPPVNLFGRAFLPRPAFAFVVAFVFVVASPLLLLSLWLLPLPVPFGRHPEGRFCPMPPRPDCL
jgi:hypothetical protein